MCHVGLYMMLSLPAISTSFISSFSYLPLFFLPLSLFFFLFSLLFPSLFPSLPLSLPPQNMNQSPCESPPFLNTLTQLSKVFEERETVPLSPTATEECEGTFSPHDTQSPESLGRSPRLVSSSASPDGSGTWGESPHHSLTAAEETPHRG